MKNGLLVIGHRGARGLAPENTLEALYKGKQHHADELEFDLRITADNIPVLHHNKHLKDPGGGKYRISKFNYSQLKEYKPDLLTLATALDTIGWKTPLHIEIKAGEPVEPVVKILKKYMAKNNWKTDDFRLASKSQKTLIKLHTALPNIEKIVIEPWSGVRARRRARQLGAERISMNQLWLWYGFIFGMKRSGYKLSAYTLNRPKKARRWAKYGLYGVITDYPDLYE